MQEVISIMHHKVCVLLIIGGVIGAQKHQCSESYLGDPDTNILSRENRDVFIFSGYPNVQTGNSLASNVADEHSYIGTANWPQYGYQTKADSAGVAYLLVDLKQQYIVRAFAVTGYANGSHKPTGEWYLEGSNDNKVFRMVGVGRPDQWLAPGTYPFKPSQIIVSLYPRKYRYYRVISKGWTNGWMVIYNFGLFKCLVAEFKISCCIARRV